ncbi:serine/threonine protein kinase, partial [Streptomyces sp. NPDC001621]
RALASRRPRLTARHGPDGTARRGSGPVGRHVSRTGVPDRGGAHRPGGSGRRLSGRIAGHGIRT